MIEFFLGRLHSSVIICPVRHRYGCVVRLDHRSVVAEKNHTFQLLCDFLPCGVAQLEKGHFGKMFGLVARSRGPPQISEASLYIVHIRAVSFAMWNATTLGTGVVATATTQIGQSNLNTC